MEGGTGTDAGFYYISRDLNGRKSKVKSFETEILFRKQDYPDAKALPSKYLRVSSDVTENQICKIIQSHTNNKWPRIAVIFNEDCEVELSTEAKGFLKSFTTTILKTMGCLLITCGLHVGVTKLVGKIHSLEGMSWNHNYDRKAIGVLPWSHVRGKEELTSRGTSACNYDPNPQQTDIQCRPLDPNQDFYFLIDDGQNPDPEAGTNFITKMNVMLRSVDGGVPCIMILTGGGRSNLRAMHKFLFSKSNRESSVNKPVVMIIKGSGALADLLSAIFKIYQLDLFRKICDDINSSIEKYLGDPGTDEESRDRFKKIYDDIRRSIEQHLGDHGKDQRSRDRFKKIYDDIKRSIEKYLGDPNTDEESRDRFKKIYDDIKRSIEKYLGDPDTDEESKHCFRKFCDDIKRSKEKYLGDPDTDEESKDRFKKFCDDIKRSTEKYLGDPDTDEEPKDRYKKFYDDIKRSIEKYLGDPDTDGESKDRFRKLSDDIKRSKEKYLGDPDTDEESKDRFRKLSDDIKRSKEKYLGDPDTDEESKDRFRKLCDDIRRSEDDMKMVEECILFRFSQVLVCETSDENGAESHIRAVLHRVLKAVEAVGNRRGLFAYIRKDKVDFRVFLKDNPKWVFSAISFSIKSGAGFSLFKSFMIEYGFDTGQYVKDNLWDLYDFDKTRRQRVQISEFDIGKLRDFLSRPKYGGTSDKAWNIENIGRVLEDLSDGIIAEKLHKFKPENSNGERETEIFVINPIQALLINSIVCLDFKLAKLFWYYDSKNPLSNALLAYVLLSGLKRNAKKVYKSSKDEFEESLAYFELLMCTLLKTYSETSTKMTQMVLKNKHELWKYRSLIEVAGLISLRPFFGNKGSRTYVEKAWNTVTRDNGSGMERGTNPSGEKSNPSDPSGEKSNPSDNNKKKYWWETLKCPMWKWRVDLFMYLVSLLSFAFYVLFNDTAAHEPIRYVVTVIVAALAIDELIQMTSIQDGWHRTIRVWASSTWNIFDVFTIALFTAGFILYYYDEYSSKVFFTMYLGASWFKMMQFLGSTSGLGVYIVMIGKMLAKMVGFFLVFLVSIVAYGLFMTALLHSSNDAGWLMLFHVLFRPFLLLFGEPGVESFELKDENTVFGTRKTNQTSEILAILGMAAFVLFANILLLNLLIADFSNIHEEYFKKSAESWCFAQFVMLEEYRKKTSVPIPFSIIPNLIRLLCGCRKKRKEAGQNTQTSTPRDLMDKGMIADFERSCFNKLFEEIPNDLQEVEKQTKLLIDGAKKQ